VARLGLDVTPLGELVFPDGRIVGHRSLRRYYKQRVSSSTQPATAAVLAARQAAGERLYQGRVYNIGYETTTTTTALTRADDRSRCTQLALAGIAPGLAQGRAGKGLLVAATTSNGGASSSSYSQVSVYRFRAAVRQQRRGIVAGQRLQQRTSTNMNRMDKKANRLMNGVSVAHAAR
jgi:pre-60S factor REI1